MASVPTVEVNNLYPDLTFSPARIDRFFHEIFSLHQHGCSGDLSVVFLDRSSHSQIHGNFLKDFRPTDVITFPADPSEEMAGEICVSVDQAIEEAKAAGGPILRRGEHCPGAPVVYIADPDGYEIEIWYEPHLGD